MSRPKDADSGATFEAIVRAAARVVTSRRALSLRATAQEAGLSLGTIQYYFPTHEALVRTCVEKLSHRSLSLVRRLAHACEAESTTPALPLARVISVATRESWRVQLAAREPELLEETIATAASLLHQPLRGLSGGIPEPHRMTFIAAWTVAVTRLYSADGETLATLCNEACVRRAKEVRRRHLRRWDLVWGDPSSASSFLSPSPSAPSVPSTTTADDPAAAILATARDVLATTENLKLSLVAERLGMTVSGVRHYFPTRDALIHGIIDDHDRAQLACVATGVRRLTAGAASSEVIRDTLGEIYGLHVEISAVTRLRHEDTASRMMSPRITPALFEGYALAEGAAAHLGLEPRDLILTLRVLGFIIVHFADWQARHAPRDPNLRRFIGALGNALLAR
ncbi:MAG: hypothetical protein AAF928_08230 [Myxococcota bacterium]